MKKQDTISLSQIGLYNPQRVSDEVMEKLFIVRQKVFQFLMNKIKSENKNSIPQHHLIIAQRGMGKTTLLKRIEVEIRKNADYKHFIPLLYPEEQYNLSNLAELWLNSLDSMADTLQVENKDEIVRAIDTKVRELGSIKNDEELARAAYQYLMKVAAEIDRRPVLLIDNLNLVFDRISKAEQHTLRSTLMQNNAPILIGASAISIDDTHDYGAPFYDAFQMHYLPKLSFEELVEILKQLAVLTNAEELLPTIQEEIARLKTIHQLTGGNPRTAVMLFKLIVRGFSKEINDDLEALLDEITPLYKARFEELSAQNQKIVDVIALHWDPINLEQLRNETRIENGTLSPQLKRLVEVGWIEKSDAYKAKGSAYSISERFFNIWFLMRRSSRRQKKEILCLSKFLESFYGENLSKIAKNRLGLQADTLNHVTYNLAMAEVLKDKKLSQQLKNKSYQELREFAKDNPEILKQFDMIEEPIFEDTNKEEQSILRKIKQNPKNSNLYFELGILYHHSLKKYQKAEKAYLKAIELDKKLAYAWNNLGNLYQDCLGKYQEAEEAYLKAIELDKNLPYFWINLGNLYKDYLEKYQDAEKVYLKAIELDKSLPYFWDDLGNLYTNNLQKYQDAERAYFKAIELDENYTFPWINLGNLYQYHLGKYQDAEKAYLKAIELDKNDAYSWNNLGNLYQDHLGEYQDAEKAYLKATELNKNDAHPWYNLGNLYRKLNRYIEAEKGFLKAIELDNNFSFSWNNLGHLYKNHLKKYQDAESAYFKAIEIDKNFAYPWYGLGNLYQHLGKYQDAEKAYLKAIKLDKYDSASWNSLGNLYQDYFQNYEKAEKAYLKAIDLDMEDNYPKLNLIFLYRDKLNKIKEAKEIFKELPIVKELEDSYWLHQTLFDLYNKNEGIAKESFEKAINLLKNDLPFNTQDDWYRFGGVVTKLGYGTWLLEILESKGYNVILAPYYVAIKALNEKDQEGYLNSKAIEVREPAKKIIEIMQKYLK